MDGCQQVWWVGELHHWHPTEAATLEELLLLGRPFELEYFWTSQNLSEFLVFGLWLCGLCPLFYYLLSATLATYILISNISIATYVDVL